MSGRAARLSTGGFLEVCTHLLGSGCTVRFRAHGWSMYPLIQDGDLLHVAPAGRDDVHRGDIVLCGVRHQIVAHRVTQIRHTAGAVSFKLRGDATFGSDGWVDAGAVLGKVVASERAGRRTLLDTRARRAIGLLAALGWRGKRWAAETWRWTRARGLCDNRRVPSNTKAT